MTNIFSAKSEKANRVIRNCSFWVTAILVIVLLAGCTGKNTVDSMFQLEEPFLTDLKIKSNSSFQIDSYTISLADGVYDENTKLGLLLFKVINSEGAVDANISSSNQLGGNTFGKRFSIAVMGSHGRTVYAKRDGDDLYILYQFEAKDYINGDLSNSVCLTDFAQLSKNGQHGKEYYFSLDTVGKAEKIQIGKTRTMYISALGFLVEAEKPYTIKDMKLVMKDGSEIEIINDDDYVSLSSSNEDGDKKSSYVYNQFFKKFIDCSKVDKVVCNGHTYSVAD